MFAAVLTRTHLYDECSKYQPWDENQGFFVIGSYRETDMLAEPV